MKRSIAIRLLGSLLALVVMTGALLPDPAAAGKTRYDKVLGKTPALRDFQVPDVRREVLDNGMVVYLVEDHDLPLVRINAMARAGSIYEPSAKVGLAQIVGEVMRTGGTAEYPGDDLDVFLEDRGATVEVTMRDAHCMAFARCLTENLDEVLPVFAGILREPAFPAEKIDLAKTQAKTAISRRNDDASQIAWREIFKLYYGESSPYARQQEYDTIAAIEDADLGAFHDYFFHPNNIILVVGGDIDSEAMLARITEAFADWEEVETFYPPDPVIIETESSISYVFKEDVNQSKIRLGHLGIKHDDEFRFPLEVLNQILGGGFGSRLFSEVRSKRELAYAVWAWMIVGDHHRMPFTVGVDTKSESTVEAIELIREELRKVTHEEVTDEELQRAKDGLKNSFVFEFSSPFSIARTKASYEFWSQDPDFLDTYLAKVDAVSAADILAAAKARIHPEEMAILVVGRAEDFDKPLSSLGLGEPNEIDVTIPEPSFVEEEIPEATEENLAAGLSLMKKALAAHGGAKAADGIGALDMSGDLTIKETAMGPLTFNLRSRSSGKDRLRIDTSTPFGNMVQIIAGDEGWRKTPMGTQALSAGDIEDAWRNERRELLRIFQRVGGLKAQALGTQELEGEACEVVYLLEPGGEHIKIYLDPGDHRVKGLEYRDKSEMGPVLNLTLLADHRKEGGFLFAHDYKVHHDGTLFATFKVTQIVANPSLEDELFTEPAQ